MITLEQKIKKSDSVTELINEINLDKISNNILSKRFPVRFIFLESFDSFRVLTKELDRKSVQIVDIEKMLSMPDGWITKDELFAKIESFEEDTTIVPFSEIARFYSKIDFQNFFNRLMLLENTNNLARRIYLPLIGLEQRFEKDFFQNFSRKLESPPIWGVYENTPQKVKVILTEGASVNAPSNYRVLKNTEEWLCFWKKEYSPCDIICSSKSLSLRFHNSLPDSIFTIEQIKNTKELIEQVFGKNIPIEYNSNEQVFWNKLLGLIDNDFSTFGHVVKKHCNVKNLTIENLLSVWLQHNDDFTKWLLKHYIISQECLSEKYIYRVLSSVENYSNQTILEHLLLDIFPLSENYSFIKERDKLIKSFKSDILLPENTVTLLKEKFSAISDVNQAVEICAGMFAFEKEFMLKNFINGNISREKVEQVFPDILYYTAHTTFENLRDEQSWVVSYLSDYKKAKLSDIFIPAIGTMINEKNANDTSFYGWYHSFKTSKDVLSQYSVDKVYWVDGLGIEWISFIENYLQIKNDGKLTIRKMIAHSNLPTSTEHNRYENVDKKIESLDKYIHDNLYKYPNSVFDEFEIVKQIVDTILVNMSDGQEVAIISDHGLTALSRLVGSKKYGKNDSHEGRYIEVPHSECCTDSDYIKHKSDVDGRNYLIALKHNSLGRKPIREVHGGCTPEEVLVPVIFISNKPVLNEVDYDITLINPEIQRSNQTVEFSISGTPSIVYMEIKGKRSQLSYNENENKWIATLDKILSGHQTIKIIIGKKEKTFDVNIKAGMREEDLF